MKSYKTLYKEYSDELRLNVDWPSFEELQSHTITVLVASFLLAFAIFIVDLVFNTGLTQLYGLFN